MIKINNYLLFWGWILSMHNSSRTEFMELKKEKVRETRRKEFHGARYAGWI